VHYSGWTTDGKMFDSSVRAAMPATFPLNGVIPGWTEGVQLMVVGEKTRFWIPGNLAYDNSPRPGAPKGRWCSTSSCSRSKARRAARTPACRASAGPAQVTRRRRLIFALAALVGVTCGTAGTPPPLHLLPVKEHTLPSGLRVVIEQDETSGVAGVVLTVDVGSVDDPPGKHGLAHTLEHLVFRAPDANGDSMFSRLVRWAPPRSMARPTSRRPPTGRSDPGTRSTSCWRSFSDGWPTRSPGWTKSCSPRSLTSSTRRCAGGRAPTVGR
jgi:hypothetical protein